MYRLSELYAYPLKELPKAWKGQYHNPKNEKLATISFKALFDRDFYCWHWRVGCCGINNDLAIMNNSPLMTDIMSRRKTMTLLEGYVVNGQHREFLLYMLVDGIYTPWVISMRPVSPPQNDRMHNMQKGQEGVHKDVERFFGCLQVRFGIMRKEIFEWSDESTIDISNVCVMMHNMIVELTKREELHDEGI